MEPHLARLHLATKTERRSTPARERSPIGRARVGARLDRLQYGGVARVLHDRRIPGTQRNIDHVVVAPSAIWVVRTENHRGAIHQRDVGRWFGRDDRLFIAGRDRTDLLEAIARQTTAVRDALTPLTPPIRPVLCFTRAEWPFLSNPFELDGVLITWPRALVKQIRATPASELDVSTIAKRISSGLPYAPER